VCLNDIFNFIIRSIVPIFQDSFQQTKEPKTRRIYVWWITESAIILKDDAYHISPSPLIQYDTLDVWYILNTLIVASDDEKSDWLGSNPEKYNLSQITD
jgi:hypothetical protein